MVTPPTVEELEARAAPIARLRRKRRRLSSVCFFVAGIAFGTLVYLLRARFYTLVAPGKRVAFFGLVALMAIVFWLGARAEAEVGSLDDKLRELREQVSAARRRPRKEV